MKSSTSEGRPMRDETNQDHDSLYDKQSPNISIYSKSYRTNDHSEELENIKVPTPEVTSMLDK